jgi:formylmethanofuran dehydrogenase subunit A
LCKIEEKPEVEPMHLHPNAKKSDGSYVITVGTIKRFDEYVKCLVMDNGQRNPISSILEICSEVIDDRCLC